MYVRQGNFFYINLSFVCEICALVNYMQKIFCSKIRKNILARAFRLSHHKQRSIQYKDFKFVYNMFLAEEKEAYFNTSHIFAYHHFRLRMERKIEKKKNEKIRNANIFSTFYLGNQHPTANEYGTHMTVFGIHYFWYDKEEGKSGIYANAMENL